MFFLGHSNVLLRTLYFIGIAPCSKSTKFINLKNFAHLIPLLLSSLLSLSLTIFLFIFPHFESAGSIHTIINFSYVASLLLSNLSANCQCLFYKSVYHKTISGIRQIENSYTDKHFTKFIFRFERLYKIKILVIFILFFASQGLVFREAYLVSEENGNVSGMWSSFIISLLRILYPMHILHIVLYCDIIALFIKENNFQVRSSSMFLHTTNKVEFLKNIKLFYMELFKLITQINIFFGYNLLFLMINSFIYISYQLYWIFLSVQLHLNMLSIIGRFSTCLFKNLIY